MTDRLREGPWGAVAAALEGAAPEGPGPAQAAPTPGWAQVRRALTGRSADTATPRSGAAPATPAADPAAAPPAGWGALHTALGVDDGRADRVAADRADAGDADHPGDADAAGVTGDPADTDRAGDADADADDGVVADAAGSGRRRRRRAVAGLAAAAVVAGAVAGGIAVFGGGGTPSDVAFTVNGTAVTLAKFDGELTVRQTLYGIQPPAASDKSAYHQYLTSAAQAEAVSTLLDQLAPRNGVTVSQQAAQQKLDQAITTQYGGQSGFATALASAGLNEAQVLAEVQHNLVYQQLFAKVAGTPKVTDAQVRQWFDAHRDQLAIPETRQISHIVVASKADADAIVSQLKGGASFASLAAKSLDTSTASNGGQLGLYAKDDLKSTFADAAFAAAPNVPFGPVQEGSGTTSTWEVGEVTAVNPAGPATLTPTVAAAIKTVLTDQAEADAWDAWLGAQLRKADIHYAAAYRPTHPDAPPVIPVPKLTGETIAGVGPAASASSGAAGSPTTGGSPAPGGSAAPTGSGASGAGG
ncbi:MAG TPA: peptidyl-prolyl cis-trans isomerase [Acidimicrobiales bacterium]|nr:peptidyl-prolyl cis-trans isomerase [Acidimicrobiales bacterium]